MKSAFNLEKFLLYMINNMMYQQSYLFWGYDCLLIILIFDFVEDIFRIVLVIKIPICWNYVMLKSIKTYKFDNDLPLVVPLPI